MYIKLYKCCVSHVYAVFISCVKNLVILSRYYREFIYFIYTIQLGLVTPRLQLEIS